MILSQSLKEQLKEYLKLLKYPVILRLSSDESESSQKVTALVNEIATLSDKISVVSADLALTPSFAIDRQDYETGIVFAGLPLGHEFESLVLALLQVGGHAPKITDQQRERIAAIHTKQAFTTFVSLSCHNCPDVVQAFNIISLLNDNVSHTMVEGSMFQDLTDKLGIMAVPTVMKDGKEFISGRQTLDNILDLILGQSELARYNELDVFDQFIIGGGPAGITAAIYSARKGLKTGIIAKDFGGQVMETSEIANITGTPLTTGETYMANCRNHMMDYDVTLLENVAATHVESAQSVFQITLSDHSIIESKTLIVATGARWKSIHVPGEQEFKNKGIAYCVHCDGPLFKDKSVAIIGGGNSGIEAAIDLSHIVQEVTILEFGDHLNADRILQDKLATLDNVNVILNANTKEILGDQKVNGLTYEDRQTGKCHHLSVEGVFILVGLDPNTEFLNDTLQLNDYGEIVIDAQGRTSVDGIFAAGDCTDVPFKQIIIAEGAGATASLSAFDYLIRH
nr:alkyl hydroperoxide reductase subunit F [Allofustis seminis]